MQARYSRPMPVALNHTIVHARDARATADFYSEVFGLAKAVPFGPFLDLVTANGVTLAILGTDEKFEPQHYAFLVSEEEFDEVFSRIKGKGIRHWADPARRRPGGINHNDGGRGVYFEDPDGHFLEIITRPYGSAD